MTWTLDDVDDEMMAARDLLQAADTLVGENDDEAAEIAGRARRHYDRAHDILRLIRAALLAPPLPPEEFAETRADPRPVEMIAVGGNQDGKPILFTSLNERAWLAHVGDDGVAAERTTKDELPNFPPEAKVRGFYEPASDGTRALWHPVFEPKEDAPVC